MIYLVRETAPYEREYVIVTDEVGYDKVVSLVDSNYSHELTNQFKLAGKLSYKVEKINDNDPTVKKAIEIIQEQIDRPPKVEKKRKKKQEQQEDENLTELFKDLPDQVP